MRLLAAAMAFAAALSAKDKISAIEFFGYRGIDVEKVRQALPVHPGDARPRDVRKPVRDAVRRVLGRDATDVAPICCVGDGDAVIFIGLPGTTSHTFAYNVAPAGHAPLARALRDVYRKMDAAEGRAMRKGVFAEDGRPGYRLSKDPEAAAAQLAMHEYALRHEDEIVRTLEGESDARLRALAADALGYGVVTPRQIAALVHAAHDADDDVRNNATRALGEMLGHDPKLAVQIPVGPFLALIRSGVWTDRNKGSMVLEPLTEARDPKVLAEAAGAWDEISEMAHWAEPGWSMWPRLILGRIAGVPEERLTALVDGAADAFFATVKRPPN